MLLAALVVLTLSAHLLPADKALLVLATRRATGSGTLAWGAFVFGRIGLVLEVLVELEPRLHALEAGLGLLLRVLLVQALRPQLK